MRLPPLCLTAVLLVPLAGCGTAAYRPHPSPRLQVVPGGGAIALTRDGRTYPIGMFGSGLEEAVKGNPRAEKEVSAYQSKSVAGFVLGLTGSLGMGGGIGLLVGNELGAHPQENLRVAAFALSIGGVVMGVVANVLTGSAQPHMWNAINMYNDDLPPPYGHGAPYGRPLSPYPAAPGYGAPQSYPGAPYATPPTWAPPAAPVPSAPPNAPPSMPPAPAPVPSAPAPMPSAPR